LATQFTPSFLCIHSSSSAWNRPTVSMGTPIRHATRRFASAGRCPQGLVVSVSSHLRGSSERQQAHCRPGGIHCSLFRGQTSPGLFNLPASACVSGTNRDRFSADSRSESWYGSGLPHVSAEWSGSADVNRDDSL
jgi:hypothetical protein